MKTQYSLTRGNPKKLPAALFASVSNAKVITAVVSLFKGRTRVMIQILTVVALLVSGSLYGQTIQFIPANTNKAQLVTIPGIVTNAQSYSWANSPIVGVEMEGSNLVAGRVVQINTNVVLNWGQAFSQKGCFIAGYNYTNGAVSINIKDNGWGSAYWNIVIDKTQDLQNFQTVDAIYWPDTDNFRCFNFTETNAAPYLYRVRIITYQTPDEAQHADIPMG